MARKPIQKAATATAVASTEDPAAATRLEHLRALESKILWLAVWMIHHANHIRPKRDYLKVGGHQASSASVASIMTALYMDVLTPRDRVAVKPHASPIFHAIQYLFGRQSVEKMRNFRALGGAQSYPSRTKDIDDVDFSTGSVGLGVAMTSFASLVQDYVHLKSMVPAERRGRMVAIVGDAELDEGNVFEALLEGWKHDIRNVWWIIDYNRQSLDAVVSDRLFQRLDKIFQDMGWRVVTLKYGRRMLETFRKRGGDALKAWIDESSNTLYSALSFQGGGAWRTQVMEDIGGQPGVEELLASLDDAALHGVMTDLGGHDLETLTQAFHGVTDDMPTCFIAYTIKGMRLPFAGHKDNHAGMMTADQIALLKEQLGIRDGDEWEKFAGLEDRAEALETFIRSVPFAQGGERRFDAPQVFIPADFEIPRGERVSTQEAFGRVLAGIARQHPDLAEHIVTTAPDVTTSTNLGPWVNRRGIFSRHEPETRPMVSQVASPQQWMLSPKGQHIELGIAENNLFIMLAALGLSHSLFGARLLPIGTVYDPFVARGLDALNYACYQDARFILAGTPSGISLAPEGGAHQSIYTTLIGMGQPNLVCYEPAFADDLTEILRWSLEHMQREDGSSVYLRLSTRPIPQPERRFTNALRRDVIDGGYWLEHPAEGAELAIVASGAVLPEAIEAHRQIAEDVPGAGLLVVTSPGRLERGWSKSLRTGRVDSDGSHVASLLAPLSPRAGLVTVLDGHPSTLAWLGSVHGHRIISLGVDRFGQSGDIPDLYKLHGIDTDAIVDAAARLCVMMRLSPRGRHVN
ncbi:MAG: 1-deoxy-D-xylulose-5-phosphate synthase N-terminal domain-containing protein [Vicinamibacterales bacterium]